MPLGFPPYLWWAVLKPIRKRHVTVCKVKRIISSNLGSDGVLLRKHQTHDFAKLDIVEEELNVYGVGGVFRRSIGLIIDEVVFRHHLDI